MYNLFLEKIIYSEDVRKIKRNNTFACLLKLIDFAGNIHVYMDQNECIITDMFITFSVEDAEKPSFDNVNNFIFSNDKYKLKELFLRYNVVMKNQYDIFDSMEKNENGPTVNFCC